MHGLREKENKFDTFSFALSVPNWDNATTGGTAPSRRIRVQNLRL